MSPTKHRCVKLDSTKLENNAIKLIAYCDDCGKSTSLSYENNPNDSDMANLVLWVATGQNVISMLNNLPCEKTEY